MHITRLSLGRPSFRQHLRQLCATSSREIWTENFEPVVGLEVHLQINSRSKLFSNASTSLGGGINRQVSAFDAAIPGTLPVLNRRCVEAAVQTALALECAELNNVSRFDRKHYFYADMPAGFQITQQFHPIARKGNLNYYQMESPGALPEKKSCKILQLQLEQDSGRSVHDAENRVSLIDLNRAGVGLLEVVFAPDLKSGKEAADLVKELIAIVKAIGVCSGRMEDGAVRVDANISVHQPGTPLGTRTEVKNLNSLRAVSRAIDLEIRRQMFFVKRGLKIQNVTLSFDSETVSTVVMRDKEIVQDYRFFPEPNIPSLNLQQAGVCIESLRHSLPSLPHELRKRLMDTYGLDFWKCVVIVREPGMYEFFTQAMNYLSIEYAKQASNILLIDIIGYMNKHSMEFEDVHISPKQFADLIRMVGERRLPIKKCLEVLQEVIESSRDPEEIVELNNWWMIKDENLLGALCEEAIRLYPKHARKAQVGKQDVLKPLMSHIQIATQGRADMKLAKRIMLEKIQRPEMALREEVNAGR